MEVKSGVQVTKIHLEELEGEAIDIDFQRAREDQEGQLLHRETETLHAPDYASFGAFPFIKIVDGFTLGAIKNMINISAEKVRLYEIKDRQINLLSCTDLPSEEIKSTISDSGFRLRFALITHKQDTKIQIVSGKGGKGFILRFSHQTGQLLSTELVDLREKKDLHCPRYFDIESPKKSKSDVYLYGLVSERLSFNDRVRHNFVGEFGKIRKERFLRWFSLDRMSRRFFNRVKKRFESLKSKLNAEISRSFMWGEDYKLNAHNYGLECASKSLVYSASSTALIFFLLDLDRRKILKFKEINIFDFFEDKRMIDYFSDEFQYDNEAERQADLNLDLANFQNFQKIKIQITSTLYLPKLQKFFMIVQIKRIEVIIRLDNVFENPSEKHFHITKRVASLGTQNILMSYGDTKILTYYPGQARSEHLRPLAWLDPETLKETKIPGLEESDQHSAMNIHQFRVRGTCLKLNPTSMVILSQSSAFIFDLTKNRVLAEQLHTFRQKLNRSALINIRNLYVFNHHKHFHILKTRVSEDGKEVLDRRVAYYLVDFFPDFKYTQRYCSFNFFELESGDYLFLGAYKIDLDGYGERLAQSRLGLVSLKIGSGNIEVLEKRFRDMGEWVEGTITLSDVRIVSNMFVFGAKIRNEVLASAAKQRGLNGEPLSRNGVRDGDRDANLVLSTLEFEILDFCEKAKLSDNRAVKMAYNDKIVSQGSLGQIYLHQVDCKKMRLRLLRVVEIEGAHFMDTTPNLRMSPSYLCCLFRPKNVRNTQRVILVFDKDLNKRAHLKYRTAEYFKTIYWLTETRIVFCYESENHRRGLVYLADLRTGDVEFVCESTNMVVNFTFSGNQNRACVLDLGEEKMTKIFLD